MFTDYSKIKIASGKGGDGTVSFHREKYVASGGPDGGDGGRGGDVVFVVDDNLATLSDFRYKRSYSAQDGENGSGARRTGKSGSNLEIRVPRGTLIRDAESGRLLADMSQTERYVAAQGGRGGAGNQHYATSTRQTPRFAKTGEDGRQREVELELKLLADVGLVGFPNVGKSTLLSRVSNARPKIANYHFTTINPNLGIVDIGDYRSFVMADIPGLIEGAGEGAGLGHRFLRHIDRCRLIVHLVDVAETEDRDAIKDFEKINAELAVYDADLATRPQIIAANKCDAAIPEQIELLQKYADENGYEMYPISAVTGEGIKELVSAIVRKLDELPPIKVYEPDIEPEEIKVVRPIEVKVHDGVFELIGGELEKAIRNTNFDDYESLQYFQKLLVDSGAIDMLERAGIKEDDTVRIGEYEFDYVR